MRLDSLFKVESALTTVGVVGAAVVLFVLYKKYIDPAGTRYAGNGALGGLANAANNLTGGYAEKTGDYVGTTLADWFQPATADVVYYRVQFPDGQFHAVPSDTIDKGGYFLFQGIAYQLKTGAHDSKIALPALEVQP